MIPRILLITLGVDDLARSLAFYRDGLGLPTKGIVGTEFEHGAVAFFDLQPGLQLAIWPRADLAHDAHLEPGPRSATELSLGHNVGSPAEVHAVMEQARLAGSRIVTFVKSPLTPARETDLASRDGQGRWSPPRTLIRSGTLAPCRRSIPGSGRAEAGRVKVRRSQQRCRGAAAAMRACRRPCPGCSARSRSASRTRWNAFSP